MSSLPVYADAVSRLQADIALVRLIRAGIPISRISAVFPRRSAPNSVCCWLKNFTRIPRTSWPTAAAGLMAKVFKSGIRATHVANELDELGLGAEVTGRICEKIEEGRIVLFVHARTETEAAVAWHVFQHVNCENITLPADHHLVAPADLPALAPQIAVLAA
jgi:hypothetical protein